MSPLNLYPAVHDLLRVLGQRSLESQGRGSRGDLKLRRGLTLASASTLSPLQTWVGSSPPHPCLPRTVSLTDCFVSLWLPTASQKRLRTRTISNCRNPEWNESFSFQIQSQVKVRRGDSTCPPCPPVCPLLAALSSLFARPSHAYLSFFLPTSCPTSPHSPTPFFCLSHSCPSGHTYPSTVFPISLSLSLIVTGTVSCPQIECVSRTYAKQKDTKSQSTQ